MKLLPAVLTGCLLALPALAIAQDVKIDYDKAFNFAPVKTYTIKIGTTWGNDLSQRRVLDGVRSGHRRQGLEEGRRGPGGYSRGPPRCHPDQAQRQHVLQRHGRLRIPLRRHGGMGTASTT